MLRKVWWLRGLLQTLVAHPGGFIGHGHERGQAVGRGGSVAGRVVDIFEGVQRVGLGSRDGWGPTRASERGNSSGFGQGEAAGAGRERLQRV